MTIFLRKTQDAWIVSDGDRIVLTKSVRRVDRPWARFLAYYMGFSTASLEFQTNFGGRIVPTKRAVGAQALGHGPMPPLEAITYRYRGLDAEEVENYAKSYQGRAEAMRELQETAEELGRELLVDPGTPQRQQLLFTLNRNLDNQERQRPEDKPMEKLEDVIFVELLWERALKKTPPPESAVASEPAKQNRRKVVKFFADSGDSG